MSDAFLPLYHRLAGTSLEELTDGVRFFITPGSVCHFDAQTPSNGLHSHTFFEMCFVTGGHGLFDHGGIRRNVSRGDIFIADPDVAHEISVADPTRDHMSLVFCSFSLVPADPHVVTGQTGHALAHFLDNHAITAPAPESTVRLSQWLAEIATQDDLPAFFLESSFRHWVFSQILTLSRAHTEVPMLSGVSPVVRRAIGFMQSHPGKRPPVSDIARHAGTSVRNLQLLFHRETGRTLVAYFNERRMAVAAGYLRMHFQISEVSDMLGLEDPAQFSRMFRKHYRCSPKAFQQHFATAASIRAGSTEANRS